MRTVLPKDAYMIVFDTAKSTKGHYQIIRQFYSLVKECVFVSMFIRYNAPIMPGQEFTGITVYKNDKQSDSIQTPAWW